MAFFNDWYIKLADESTSQRLKSWGIATHVDAEIAAAKTSYQDIFGLNGAIDYSEFASGVKYQNRKIKMYLVIREEDILSASGLANAQDVCEAFARKYHGQRVEISRSIGVSEWQTYKGRLQIKSDSKSKAIRLVTCIIEADPFVYFAGGTTNITPKYKTRTQLTISEGTKIENGGLIVSEVGTDRSKFQSGSIGRYGVWGITLAAGVVVFTASAGTIAGWYIEYFDANGNPIKPDVGYQSTSGETIKVKITATTPNSFNAGVSYYSFNQNEIRNISGLKMPSDISYSNSNSNMRLLINGNVYPIETTGANRFELLLSDQLQANQSNWIAALTETSGAVSTATNVIVNYDNRDLVGDCDV